LVREGMNAVLLSSESLDYLLFIGVLSYDV